MSRVIENKDEFMHELAYYTSELKSMLEEYGAEVQVEEYNDITEITIKYGGD